VMAKSLLATAVLVALAGCAAPRQVTPMFQRRTTFLEEEYRPFASEGTASIGGQVFLKTQGGDVKFGAGNDVILTPVTSYSREWIEIRVLRDKAISPPDSRAESFSRSALADGEGRFRFEHLPAGDYYVACYITWMVAGVQGLEKTGGWAFSMAHVDSGSHSEIIATKPDLSTRGRLGSNTAGTRTMTPLTTPYTVRLESGEVLGVTEMQVRAGMLRVTLPSGATRDLNPAHVLVILDAQGTDWTSAALDEERHLKSELTGPR
jgi:hypothetical protein